MQIAKTCDLYGLDGRDHLAETRVRHLTNPECEVGVVYRTSMPVNMCPEEASSWKASHLPFRAVLLPALWATLGCSGHLLEFGPLSLPGDCP